MAAILAEGAHIDKIKVLNDVRQDGLALKFADELQDDEEIVLAAVQQNGLALQFAEELINDIAVVQSAVQQNGLALQFASEILRDNIEVVKNAVSQNGLALEFASKTLRNDIEVVLPAVRQNGHALKFASETLRANKTFLMQAGIDNPKVLNFMIIEMDQYPNKLTSSEKEYLKEELTKYKIYDDRLAFTAFENKLPEDINGVISPFVYPSTLASHPVQLHVPRKMVNRVLTRLGGTKKYSLKRKRLSKRRRPKRMTHRVMN